MNAGNARLHNELKNASSRVTYLEAQGLLQPSTGEQSLPSAAIKLFNASVYPDRGWILI